MQSTSHMEMVFKYANRRKMEIYEVVLTPGAAPTEQHVDSSPLVIKVITASAPRASD